MRRQPQAGLVRASSGEAPRAPSPRHPHDNVRALASAIGNAAFARIAARSLAPTTAGALRAGPAVRQLQRTLVLVIGEDRPGDATIADAANATQSKDPPALGHKIEPLERVGKSPGSLRTPAPDEDIYFVAHGDNPGHPEVARPNLGDFHADGIVRLLERVLKPLKEPYRGTIYLSGCYTSARLHDEEGIRGRSLLDEVALGLQDSKWATKRLAPEVQLVGYPGPEMQSASGAVAIESPYERHEYRKLRGRGKTKQSDDGPFIVTKTEDSLVRRRWRQKPAYLTNKHIKKNQ